MKFELATLSDLDAITELVTAVSAVDILPTFNEQGKNEFNQRVLPDLATALDPTQFLSLKALNSEGELVGFGAMRDSNYIMHLFVAKSCQGQGLGKAMLQQLLEFTSARTISLRSSINGVGFYQANGFVATDKEGEFNGIRFVPMTLER
uniref:GNAT family N-acetyltransferase n=1 Tax=Thaumasiovibrio occultus TaxID=1891184 RepID=UPI000B35D6BF|nr:GNAT family N-acetyltransferase [Thaumasiovibrio occultus]